ncbi:hypothetical protein AK830_g6311 [Neonectria ditissima]|uniref:Uncharacterized protein n=1 Tax=Neonectria ditissima TaxID=78410 RepID=A0A0P7B0R2_9HYPO|nr:hypothetical protein AK830_g6311 [Neonectria ditissima]
MCTWVETLLECEACGRVLVTGGKKLEECQPAIDRTGYCLNGIEFETRHKDIRLAGCPDCSQLEPEEAETKRKQRQEKKEAEKKK